MEVLLAIPWAALPTRLRYVLVTPFVRAASDGVPVGRPDYGAKGVRSVVVTAS